MNILASLKAKSIIDDYLIKKPDEILLENIISDHNIIIQEKEIKGAEGRLITLNNNGVIVINSLIIDSNKKRFVLAHEFGHFILHKKEQFISICDESSFIQYHRDGNQESDANTFASELLMPTNIFRNICNNRTFSLDLLKELSKTFCTSLMATSIKYANFGNIPIALFVCVNGRIEWFVINDNFAYKYAKSKVPVPNHTLTNDIFKGLLVSENKVEIVMAKSWFDDYNIKQDSYLFEYFIYLKKYNTVLTYLALYNDNS